MGRLENKVCVVTGAARGIGRGIARRFAREGAAVVLADIVEDEGERVASEIRDNGGVAQFARTDLRRREEVFATVNTAADSLGGIDVLVNCAIALSPHVGLEDKTDEMFSFVFGVGLYGTFWGMQAAYPHMRQRGGGRIINFDSLAKVNGQLHTADYNSTKAAIGALTVSAAAEWARDGILCNSIAPAAASMGFHKLVEEMPALIEVTKGFPLGRVGDPDSDIAPVALFLASDDARYVTGQTIYVDGGLLLSTAAMFPRDAEERVQAWLQQPFNTQG
ncbi:SDR family NAD(P)-dependent oxidoreductase [Mycobacterium sp. Aquia_216]|uniref:SDR family NAD(P)-dependent oxidoreductase n=1 Tax=Mycobacterium sp. Aquia_216 TaxID=2991729 RepID=UPI00227B8855|nr:SDR family oxidoreductase [Mycobacterium sp. Aquia_216]WAJ44314.1 SDR family NAD(P)-dependent oxidoreductase [Mycobacterium sp. Aquia_216]